MQVSKQVQQSHWRVAYQGGPGCHSEKAASNLLAERFIGWPFASFAEATAAIANGQSDLVLLPVFNTTTGFIAPALEAIRQAKLKKVDALELHIDHHLLAGKGVKERDIKEVWAHRQVYLQCSNWIQKAAVKVRIVDDIARCTSEFEATKRLDLGLLGPVGVGYATGLYSVCGPVQNQAKNMTTFWLLK